MGVVGSRVWPCEAGGVDPERTGLGGAAANMSCAGIASEAYQDLSVTCVATAGVQGNATRAGDAAGWHETPEGCDKVNGTIVHLVFINQPCTESCLTTASTMLTEAKRSAVYALRVPSLQGPGLATGTGTDQFVLSAPIVQHGEWERKFSGSHNTLGMILCRAVHRATSQALELQNGLVPSMRRSIDIALGRHGFTFDRVVEIAEEYGGEEFADFLEKNRMPILFDPRTGGTAYALSEVLDLAMVGVLEVSIRDELVLDQAALLACSVANDRSRFNDYRLRLQELKHMNAMELIHHACCWGFQEKWPEYAE